MSSLRKPRSPADVPHLSADLIRLVPSSPPQPLFLRDERQNRPEVRRNYRIGAAPTSLRSWWPSKSSQLPRTAVSASLGGLAPPRIAQSFASGSVINTDCHEDPILAVYGQPSIALHQWLTIAMPDLHSVDRATGAPTTMKLGG